MRGESIIRVGKKGGGRAKKKMLGEMVKNHEQTRNHLAERGSRECVWNGSPVRVPQGDLQGIVCRIDNGQYVAGAQVYSHDQEKNWAAGPDTRWLRKTYESEPKAMAASERLVGEIAPRLNKQAQSPERKSTIALLDRVTKPGSLTKTPVQSRGRSIER